MSSKLYTLLVVLILCSALLCGCGGGDDNGGKSNNTNSGGGNSNKQPKPTASVFPADKAVGMIRGKAAWQGEIPAAKKLPPPEGDAHCMAHAADLVDESLLVNADSTVKNVFVYVKSGLGNWTYKSYTGKNNPNEQRVITQKSCTYVPHVFGIMAEQELKIMNEDNTSHNVHLKSQKNEEFNLAQKLGDTSVQVLYTEEVMAKLRCDIHSWMTSYMGVMYHPFYAVTGDNGSFEIGKLPAGTYTVEAWHEKLGAQTQTVTIAEGDAPEITFTFKK